MVASFAMLREALDALNGTIDPQMPGAREFKTLVDMVKNGMALADQNFVLTNQNVNMLRGDVQQEPVSLNGRSANEFQRLQEHTGMLLEGVTNSMTNVIKGMKGEQRSTPILESKAILKLKVLANDKTTFNVWNEKFSNAMTQAKCGTRAIFN